MVRKLLDLLEILGLAVALCDLFKILAKSLGADTAGSTFTAALVNGEVQVELGNVHHAVILVHDDKSARAHHGADSVQRLIVDRSVDMLCGYAAARRSARLGSLELLAVRDTAAYLLDDLAESGAHRYLNESDVSDLTAEGEYLSTLRGLGTHGSVPSRALADYLCDICVCFNVVQQGRLAEQTLYSGERRTGSRFAAVALDGGHERGLLTTDERACAEADLDIEIEART